MKLILAFLTQTLVVAGMAFKRLLAQRMLTLAAVAGLVIASALVLGIPLYAEATYFRLLREEIVGGRGAADYAPLNFVFEFNSPSQNSPQWQDAFLVDRYLDRDAQLVIDLPAIQSVRRFHTDAFQMFPPYDPERPGSQYFLDWAYPAAISSTQPIYQLVNGKMPSPNNSQDAPIEVLASTTLAETTGVQVGETFYLRRDGLEIPVVISGLWRPVDPNAAYWNVKSNGWLIMAETSYVERLGPEIEDELYSSLWYLSLDGSGIHSGDIAGLEKHIQSVARRSEKLLPGIKLTASPVEALKRYQESAPSLTFLLYAFSVPILALILAFIGLVAGLFIGEQRGEMAILRSRGASTWQVVWIALLQGVILGAGALIIGVPLGRLVAHGIGRSRSFLNFSAPGALRVDMTPTILILGLLGISLMLLVQVILPTLNAAKNTIVTYKQERARSGKPPWWQKVWLDVILLLPAGFGIFQLQRQRMLAAAGAEIPDPLKNPLLILVPALWIFAAALITLRLVPKIMRGLCAMIARTPSVGWLMASRYLARTPAFYSAPLVLLTLTLGLSTFTASLARTLDSHLYKQMYYRVGADLNLLEQGTTVNENSQTPVWTFRPVEEHLNLAGVQAVTQVARYPVSAIISGGVASGVFLGIDRLTFSEVGYWQRNFAPETLGTLMNALAANPDGVVISRQLLEQEGYQIGEPLTLGVKIGSGQSVPLLLNIVGVIDLFPTWYPEDGFLFIGNLDHLFLQAGGEFPHEVWVKTAPGVDPEDIVYAVRGYSILLDLNSDHSRLVEDGLNTLVKSWSSADRLIIAEQSRPERQGLFGLLSVGFIAAALLTVLGFLLYSLFSLRRRLIEMGMLRAIGLSTRQMIGLLAAELLFLVGIGIGVGTMLGVLTSRWFVPFLQVGSAMEAQYPPFRIEIAWSSVFQMYILFTILFLVALSALAILLRRMKIFQAIKLGETT